LLTLPRIVIENWAGMWFYPFSSCFLMTLGSARLQGALDPFPPGWRVQMVQLARTSCESLAPMFLFVQAFGDADVRLALLRGPSENGS
jgi:hypothetical protein